MKKNIAMILIGLAGIFFLPDLTAQTDPAKVIEQVKKFSWMVGDWQGEAWYLGRDQQKTYIEQKEHIQTRLNGTIITMEGTGFSKPSGQDEARIVFQAFGIFTYDMASSKFVLRAYQGGNFIDSELTFNPDGSFTWGIEMPYGKTRYTLRLTPEGKWNEVGEFSRDGTTWVKNFEMMLSKQ
ncbi:MAG: hypothetical protein HZB98_16015 [Bacteroidia bacterium]|nr:hypothetical protein [Bacteroidia bacterium]